MTEPEQLLKLIDGHIEALKDYRDGGCIAGMKSIRWLVYSFFNAPKKEQTKNDQQDFEL